MQHLQQSRDTSERTKVLRLLFVGQARLLAKRVDVGVEVGADSPLPLVFIAEELAAIEEDVI